MGGKCLSILSYQQVGSVDIQRFLHLKLPLTLQSMLGRTVQHRPHVVTDVAKLPSVGRHQMPAGRAEERSGPPPPVAWRMASSDWLTDRLVSPGSRKLEAKLEAVGFPRLQQEGAVRV